jgi:hypothetical protein
MPVYDPGDIVVVGAVFRVNGGLASPSQLTATVENPAGGELNSVDDPTKVEVAIGVQAPLDQLTRLGITAAENTAMVGVCTVRFYAVIDNVTTANSAGLWLVRLYATGDAAGSEDVYVQVRHPANPHVWTNGVVLA